MAKVSNAGVVVATLALTAVGLNGWKHEQHEDAIHEHQTAEQNWQVYYSAPSRQALRALLARTHYNSPEANELLRISLETNNCLHDYEDRTRAFIASCVRNTDCNQRLRVTNPNGSITLSANYGLDGLAPNSFIANYVALKINDIVDIEDSKELNEETSQNLTTIVGSRVSTSINNNRKALEACQRRLALVESSITTQSH